MSTQTLLNKESAVSCELSEVVVTCVLRSLRNALRSRPIFRFKMVGCACCVECSGDAGRAKVSRNFRCSKDNTMDSLVTEASNRAS